MRLVWIGLLVLLWVNLASGMSLLKQDNSLMRNFQVVSEATVAGIDMISDMTMSFEHNKIRTQYTTFSGEMPAFDVIIDFNEGLTYQYFNLTGECKVSKAPVIDLAEYYTLLLTNFTEFRGYRGEHLEVYEVMHPEEDGARTWIYGTTIGEGDQSVFLPTKFQTHYPSPTEEEIYNYAGTFLDTLSTPSVSSDIFEYEACEQPEEGNLKMVPSLSLMGIIPGLF
ncbi:unnamed protein product [Moneuplotes crassus]|uniref:Uncharacterized protein n=1 Tax=Euplotes crassus TaxID=5936 RepID=A0AAD1XUZ8_EUPCR|nr:unnamed protein product [Moneuplotes crassus]